MTAEWVQRQERVNRLVGLFSGELGEHRIAPNEFMDDVWLALQVIYGPGWAAELMSRAKSG
ncbi:hypothetical protein [Erwinia typographi]|uniref:hypothetical protein n=1 Tax=Erwinia typographi TaxID=371042 RepID=UPI0012EDB38E|nr:hypothetical protein [Erwinia typographi]